MSQDFGLGKKLESPAENPPIAEMGGSFAFQSNCWWLDDICKVGLLSTQELHAWLAGIMCHVTKGPRNSSQVEMVSGQDLGALQEGKWSQSTPAIVPYNA